MRSKRAPQRQNGYGDAIAVIGMAGKFPGAENIAQYWDNLRNGRESITFFTDEELETAGIPREYLSQPNYVKAKGVIKDFDAFDADFFSYPPRDAERMDPQIRLLHECAWEALEAAGYNPENYKENIGAYLGANDNLEWILRVGAASGGYGENFDHFLLNYRDYASTRISYKLNLHGPSFTLLSACSTSLVAIHLACQALRSGDCALAIAGGASIMFPEIAGYHYQEGLMFSSDGHCRAFDEKSDGTVFGDGVGVVALKPLTTAIRDRDHIHAVIRGSAVNNDGNGKIGFTTPGVEGQRQVIQAAQKAAGVKPESITFVETHGTGTKAGDPVEFEALRAAFDTKKKNYCALGAVKSNIGHVNVAAGVAAFIKTVLALEHREIPPSPFFTGPNPAIDMAESPFYVNNRLVQWDKPGKSKKNSKAELLRAGVSAFGFGGTNAHAILEQAPQSAQRSHSPSKPPHPGLKPDASQILTLSAKSENALQIMAENLADHLKDNPGLRLADVAYTLNCGRKHFEYRRAVIADNIPEAVTLLRTSVPPVLADKKNRSVVFMFPGQGSQYRGMGADLYNAEPVFRETIDTCNRTFKKLIGLDIRNYIGPQKRRSIQAERDIIKTEIAQPVIFSYSVALARLLMSWGVYPDAVIGHSLGEIIAACVADVLSLDDALYLVAHRATLMQHMPAGAMLAVQLSEAELLPHLQSDLSLAAVNAPSVCVVSGAQAAVEKLKTRLRREGVPGQYLATSHAFHSHLMDPILAEYSTIGAHLRGKTPQIPMVSTVTGDWVQDSDMADMTYWTKNLRQTVRFSDGIRKILESRDSILLEVGPGKTLSGLAQIHLSKPNARPVFPAINGAVNGAATRPKNGKSKFPTNGCVSHGNEHSSLCATMGKLWALSVPVNWEVMYENEERHRVPLPTYPFERKRFGSMFTGARPALRNERSTSWSQLKKNSDVAEWFYVPSWKRTPPPYFDLESIAEQATWLVFTDPYGLGDGVIGELKTHGQNVVVVRSGSAFSQTDESSYTICPGLHDDYEKLFSSLSLRGKNPQRIIHLWTITPGEQRAIPRAEAEHFQNLAFFSLLYISQVLGTQHIAGEVHLSVVSNHLHDILGNETIIPDKATILGPVKVIPQEYPDIRCCNIDIRMPHAGSEIPGALIHQVLSEAVTNSVEPVVAFRGDHRWVQTIDRTRLEKNLEQTGWIRDGGVYLITGGLGGIGLVIAEFLAKTARVHLILTGRSAVPPPEERDEWLRTHEETDSTSQRISKIRTLEALGASVTILVADVIDREKMQAGISAALKEHGTIHGVIHAAGIHGEGIIQLKKEEIAKGILAPKIKGTIILDELLNAVDLDFVLYCSSIASFLGGIGLVDYCAANAFMDAYVGMERKNKRTAYLSINWDMWGEVGMGLKTQMPDELKEWLVKELRDGITSAEGVAAVQRIMTWNKSRNVIVSTRDLQARIDLWVKREFIKEKESLMDDDNAAPRYLRPNLSNAFSPPETDIESRVAEIWGKLFGVEKIGRHDSFYELGGHSLLATTLVSKLKKEFSMNLSIRDVLDHPILSELSAFIETITAKGKA